VKVRSLHRHRTDIIIKEKIFIYSFLITTADVTAGTNLASASIMGITGLIGHVLNNNMDYIILVVMGPGAMVGAYLGARYSNRFSDSSLKFLIGIVLIVVAISMFWRVFLCYNAIKVSTKNILKESIDYTHM